MKPTGEHYTFIVNVYAFNTYRHERDKTERYAL